MKSEILAHRDDNGCEQSLQEHSYNVAISAKEDADKIGQGDLLFLLGLYHDLGKADRLFQKKSKSNQAYMSIMLMQEQNIYLAK